MTDDTHVDGNALGGLLNELFGREMTDQRGCCDGCGSVSMIGALVVHRGAGEVLRCPVCGAVVMVAVATSTGWRLSFEMLRWVEMSGDADVARA